MPPCVVLPTLCFPLCGSLAKVAEDGPPLGAFLCAIGLANVAGDGPPLGHQPERHMTLRREIAELPSSRLIGCLPFPMDFAHPCSAKRRYGNFLN